MPGYKVFRWERAWKTRRATPSSIRDTTPRLSVTTTGTHDTESLAEWWDTAPREERVEALKVPDLAGAGFTPDSPFDDRLRDALLATIYRSGANLVVLPIQDIFGWRDRINVPGTVGTENWTWRLPFPVGELLTRPDAAERAAFLHGLAPRNRPRPS